VTGGRLVVCPTPIGNLEDVTLRVLSALRDADVVACEDTRRTRVLLERYGVQATLISYHEHNERERTAELVERMRSGAVVALVSDAGMPLVSDPGYVLVQGCVAAGLEVEVLPGPSAALAALVASALPSDAWRFAGFLPRKRSELVSVLGSPETLVAFESPGRRLPRAHQGARGSGAGHGLRARLPLRGRAAARRGGARDRRRPRPIRLGPGGGRRRAPAGGRGRAGARGGARRRRPHGCAGERVVSGGCGVLGTACSITSCAKRSLNPERKPSPA
jgi:precorrin-6B methylase 1